MRSPFDLPPGPHDRAGPSMRMVQGIVTHASLGEVFYPLYSRPWNSAEFTAFPNVEPSSVAHNGVRPVWVTAVNTYSPIAHRNGLKDTIPPKAVTAAGVGKNTQRPRGYAMPYTTRWPQMAPRWPSWGEADGARRG